MITWTIPAIWDALPIVGEAMHCTCSGECIFFHVSSPLAIDLQVESPASRDFIHGSPLVMPENLTVMVSAGDLVLTPAKDILIVWGRRCSIRAYVGPFPSSAFAMIRDPTDIDIFASLARQTLRRGAMPVSLSQPRA